VFDAPPFSSLSYQKKKMCPHTNGDSIPNGTQDMVGIENKVNGAGGANGVNGHSDQPRRNPYAPRASDFLNNVSNFKIIESTLRGMFSSLDAVLLT